MGGPGSTKGAFALLVCLFTAAAAFATEAVAAERPNLLVIITDQQHANVMSAAGDPHVQTPHMDSLAATGVRFDRAYVTNPVCVPSRVSMISGHLPSHWGMRTNADVRLPIPPAMIAKPVGKVFSTAGYETVFGGKVHWFRGLSPEAMGFRDLTRDERDELAGSAVAFIEKKREQPFLMFVSLINPHDICFDAIDAHGHDTGTPPLYPGAKKEREELALAKTLPRGYSPTQFFNTLAPPLPDNFEIPIDEASIIQDEFIAKFTQHVRANWSGEDWRLHRWAYRRLTERVDGQIGRVLTALRKTGQDAETVVIFTSDHGDLDAAHRLEHKQAFYDEASRVPFIVSQKGVTRAGAVDHRPVSVGLDLLPTLYDYAGIAPPEKFPGRSVRALAEGKPAPDWRNHVVVEAGDGRMLRSERYKYSVFGSGKNREQLVDMVRDPGEMHNLAGNPRYRGIVGRHRGLLREWVGRVGDTHGAGLVAGTR